LAFKWTCAVQIYVVQESTVCLIVQGDLPKYVRDGEELEKKHRGRRPGSSS